MSQTPEDLIALAKEYRTGFAREYDRLTAVQRAACLLKAGGKLDPR